MAKSSTKSSPASTSHFHGADPSVTTPNVYSPSAPMQPDFVGADIYSLMRGPGISLCGGALCGLAKR